jgi:hypothetical protein
MLFSRTSISGGYFYGHRASGGAHFKKKKEISTGKINFFSRIRRIIFWRPKFVWFFPGNYVCCFADFRKFFLLFRFLFFLQSHHIAYFLVHSLANSVYFSLSVLNILAISGTNGSSGLGSHKREQIDNSTFEIVSAGDHWDLRISKQMLPLELMLG